ncbi:MAG TPA: hypothetical protein VKS81_05715 [Bacteroidota bacterium]|nr:hypothetical protein [Bacteroidota bacterium]
MVRYSIGNDHLTLVENDEGAWRLTGTKTDDQIVTFPNSTSARRSFKQVQSLAPGAKLHVLEIQSDR